MNKFTEFLDGDGQFVSTSILESVVGNLSFQDQEELVELGERLGHEDPQVDELLQGAILNTLANGDEDDLLTDGYSTRTVSLAYDELDYQAKSFDLSSRASEFVQRILELLDERAQS